MDDVDGLFRQAVAAVDAGDVATLESLLATHPLLARDRLAEPGAWLRDRVGAALDGFFQRPYLLWFVAEDPVRTGKLPGNIAAVAQAIVAAARREAADTVREQLDYALRLVCWSTVARNSGVQLRLIDTLLDAGASPDGRDLYDGRYGSHSDSAIYNNNFAAAEHLLDRGAPPTLTTTLCLGRWTDAGPLARAAPLRERQDAFVQAALCGNAEALRRLLAVGVAPTTVSERNQSHATALHHAVWSGSVEAVQVLVEAGADLTRRDTLHDATPLGWAEYGERTAGDARPAKPYAAIAAYLRGRGGV
ncbi:MAG TPA: ankyrin repeat domain-containing protein [Gemmataceae bacterium]|nr:ankyrin repeat domain-containing protein [Gemmataceae bacterium]